MSELVHLDSDRGIGTITLDSPANRNALSSQLLAELAAHLATAAGDPGIRAVVLTATGTVFCSGADLSDTGAITGSSVTLVDVLEALWQLDKTIVVALNGHVRAGGIGLVAAADIVIAPATATFAFSEVKLGVAPAIIATLCLRRMDPRSASLLMLTGDPFDAATAQRSGLITSTTAPDEVAREVQRITEQIRLTEPNAVAATKDLIRTLPTRSVSEGFAYAEEISARLFASPEATEGIAAFREKRPPPWAPGS